MLGTHQPHRPPHTTGLSLDSAFKWKRTVPTDAGLDDGADHVGVHKRIRLWWDAQPNVIYARRQLQALVRRHPVDGDRPCGIVPRILPVQLSPEERV